ncbi:hypothetical protein O3M35_002156 [Rhynocoris fuscipes]|uniref:MADF domain-containing protein n=1 Tax=Rhynocoris fuscipes TaxID=488301 RepID=A0AAW1CRI9_9HEMI
MLVQTAAGQRPGSILYHVGDGFYFRVNRQHLKTVYMRCASPGCKVTGSMAAESSRRTHIKTAGQHNHPPDLYKYEMMAFSEKLYQRCRVESTPLRTIFQEELNRAPSHIRPLLVMPHYLKRMQNLRKRLRAQSLRAKINLQQDDSVLLYEDGTPISDAIQEVSSVENDISLKGEHYIDSDVKEEDDNSDLKNIDSLVVEIQSTNLPISEVSRNITDDQSSKKMQTSPKKKGSTHGYDWTVERINILLEVMKYYYPELNRNKDNPKRIWEEIAKEIDPDVKWYTVKKKWTQLENGCRTYLNDIQETGDQGLYCPAYLEEIKEIINENDVLTIEIGSSDPLTLDATSDQVYVDIVDEDNNNHPNRSSEELNHVIYNYDHLYTTFDSLKQGNSQNTIENEDTTETLLKELLKIHRDQVIESRQRMEKIMTALEETRKEAKETAQCIKRLTDAVIHRLSTPGRIIVAQKRIHT